MKYPVTPDGRYFVVRGRLWRRTAPTLNEADRQTLVKQLMAARSAVKAALSTGDAVSLAIARGEVHAAKVAMGERGPPWWSDGAPDFNRRLVRNTPYAAWHSRLNDEND